MQGGDRSPFGRERAGDRSTDAATAPGDQRDPAFEPATMGFNTGTDFGGIVLP